MKTERGTRPLRPFSREIARHLREITEERGITQMQIATAMERRQGYVSERLSGKYPFTTDDIDAIAHLLDITGRHLLELLAERMRPAGGIGLSNTPKPSDAATSSNVSPFPARLAEPAEAEERYVAKTETRLDYNPEDPDR